MFVGNLLKMYLVECIWTFWKQKEVCIDGLLKIFGGSMQLKRLQLRKEVELKCTSLKTLATGYVMSFNFFFLYNDLLPYVSLSPSEIYAIVQKILSTLIPMAFGLFVTPFKRGLIYFVYEQVHADNPDGLFRILSSSFQGGKTWVCKCLLDEILPSMFDAIPSSHFLQLFLLYMLFIFFTIIIFMVTLFIKFPPHVLCHLREQRWCLIVHGRCFSCFVRR